MTSPKQADELLQRINRHIGQLSPHIKERETAQLLIAAYEALRVGELPNDLPSRFHAVWNDGFRDYTKEQLAWVFFQKGAMLAQPPSAPPEAGKVQADDASAYFDANGECLGSHPSPVAQGAGVEWISVKERLPELVHVENKETIFLGRILTIERMSDRVIVSLDDQDFSADMLVHIGGHEFPIWRRHGDRVKFWKPGPPKPTAPE
jgi:hypothetical protein